MKQLLYQKISTPCFVPGSIRYQNIKTDNLSMPAKDKREVYQFFRVFFLFLPFLAINSFIHAQSIHGPVAICVGSTATLTDSSSGGTWSSGNTAVATVGSNTGTITGVAPGTATISYAVSGTTNTTIVSVIPVTTNSHSGTISTPGIGCIGSTVTVTTSGESGGSWLTKYGFVAIDVSTGVVTGNYIGMDTLFYTVNNYCSNTNFQNNGSIQNIYTIVGTGSSSPSPYSGVPDYTSTLYVSGDLVADAAGNIYFCDVSANKVRKVSANGIITTIAGTGTSGNTNDNNGSAATNAQLNSPNGVFVDNTGNIFISNTGNHTIVKVNGSTGIMSTIAGTGVAGFTGDGGAATAAKIHLPQGLCEDAAGNIYFADEGNFRVREILTSGTIITVAGNGLEGYNSDGGAATTEKLSEVLDVKLDINGNLYITDNGNNRVREYVPSTGIMTTIAGNGSSGESGDGGPATAASFRSPVRLAYDGALNLYVSDQGNQVIRQINISTGVINRVAGSPGTSGFSGDGGSSTSALLNTPCGIAFDNLGNFYVSDGENYRIREVPYMGSVYANISGPSNVFTGTPITLTAYLSGSGSVSYQWQRNGSNVGSGGTTYTNSSPTNGDVYRVIAAVTPPCGATFYDTSNSITVTVCPRVSSVSGTSMVCVDSSITLTDTASGGTWESLESSVATVGSTGIVTGEAVGTTIITYSLPNICGINTSSITVTVKALDTITAVADSNGIITPSGTITVFGGSQSFAITPDSGYLVSNVVVDGSVVGATTSYTFSSVSGNHNISATFVPACIAPSISCPGNVTQAADAGTCGAVVSYGAATATGTSPTISYSQNSGTTFSAGTTTVTATATNGCGTASCNFSVTVNPNTLSVTATHTNETCYGGSNGSISTTVSGGTGSYNYSWSGGASGANPSGLSAGTYSVVVTDAGCSEETPAMTTVTITQPSALSVSPISGSGSICTGTDATFTDATSGGTWSSSASSIASVTSGGIVSGVSNGSCVISYSASALCGPVATYTVAVTSMDTITASSDTTGTIDPSGPVYICGGSQTFTITPDSGYNISNVVVDGTSVGAVSSYTFSSLSANHTISASFTVACAGPSITCAGDVDQSADSGYCGAVVTYSAATATGSSPTITYSQNSGTFFPVGTTVIYAIATDGCGADTCTMSITVTDDQNPTITAPADITLNADTGACSVASASLGTPTTSDNCSVASVTNDAAFPLPVGTTAVTWTVTDASGNVSTDVQNVTVIDNQNPTITAPTNITVNADPGLCSKSTVSLGSPVTADNCGVAMVTNNAAPPYAVGANVITWTVTDIHGNTATATQTVTVVDNQNPSITAPAGITVNADPGSCSAASVSLGSPITSDNCGVASVTNNGAPPYAVGTTVVTWTVTDIHGNTTTATQNVTVIDNQPPSITAPSNVSASGTCSPVSVSIGTPTTGDNCGIASVTNNAPSLFPVGTTLITWTATDIHGNTATATQTVTVTGTISLTETAQTNVSCNGGNNGSISTSISGGSGPYSYAWNTGATTTGLSSLSAGTYSVTVTDIHGCQGGGIYTITQPSPLSLGGTVVDNITCHGSNNGSITTHVSGGTTSYTYAWSNGSTSSSLNSLGVGTYSVTVTDAHSCSTSSSYTLTQPSALTLSASTTNVSCNGGNGTVSLTAGGGTLPYSYNWNNGASTAILSAVAGNYSVTVTDAQGCTIAGGTYTITQPAALNISATITNESCYGTSSGAISTTVSGGTSPYSYSWSNGSSSASLSSLAAGSYFLTLTDHNSCTVSKSYTVTQPAGMTIAGTITNVKCYGGSTGKVVARVTGGTAPYTYSWNTGATTASITSRPAGTYTLTVTDHTGCTSTKVFTITQASAPLALSAVVSDINCRGKRTGSITTTVTGGVTPYKYAWSNGKRTSSISSLKSGTYKLTVTDANGCKETATYIITQPSRALAVTATTTNANCNGEADGSISTTVTGGTTAYSYAWSNGSTASNISSLSAGPYSLTVTDSKGCTVHGSYTVAQPALISINPTITNIKCYGGNNGSITTAVTGGTTPYTYRWSNGSTTANLTTLVAGTYTLTVTDAHSCSQTGVYSITQPSAVLIVSASVTNVSCHGGSNGSITTTVAGGTSPYTYAWTGGATTSGLSSKAAGNYNVTVTDANSCTTSGAYSISQPAALTISGTAVNATCFGSNGSISTTVGGGATPYTYAWSSGSTTGDITAGAGAYSVTVTDHNGCTISGSYTITQPAALTITPSITNIACYGNNNGVIDLTITGGTTAYSYSWSNGSTVKNQTALTAGSYHVTVIDANGCTSTGDYSVTQPSAALNLSATVVNESCHGGSTGSVTTTVTGGTTPYSYAWTGGSTGGSITSKPAGTYNLTVTDANGCSKSGSYAITQPNALSVTGAVTNVLCYGNNTGSVGTTVTGGTTPYTYAWSNGATTSSITSVPATSYSVSVTDVNDCTTTNAYTVTQPSALTITPTITNVLCYGNSSGVIDLTVSGGVTAYSYNWSNGSSVKNQTGLSAGSYTVTVTDANACVTSAGYSVTQPSTPLNLAATITNVSCHGGNNGGVVTTVTGGTPAYTYAWTGGTTASSISSKVAGTYNLTVTDANGCTIAGSYNITQPAILTVSGVVTNVSCNGGTGSVTTTEAGGTTPYSYSWSNGATTSNITATAGSYTILVTDSKSCTATASYTITQPATLSVTGTVTNVTCGHTNNGRVDITASGGTTAYAYNWSNGSTGRNQATLTTGTYSVTVTDANGCTIEGAWTVDGCGGRSSETETTQETGSQETDIIKVYPNPTSGDFNVVVPTIYKDAEIQIIDMTGAVAERKLIPGNDGTPSVFSLSRYAQGIYFVRVATGEKDFIEKIIKK